MPDERECRCPVCNPIHRIGLFADTTETLTDKGPKRNQVPMNMRIFPKVKQARKRTPCKFCGGSERVTVDKAQKYLEALRNPPQKMFLPRASYVGTDRSEVNASDGRTGRPTT